MKQVDEHGSNLQRLSLIGQVKNAVVLNRKRILSLDGKANDYFTTYPLINFHKVAKLGMTTFRCIFFLSNL